jgi:phage tail sheath protein FI
MPVTGSVWTSLTSSINFSGGDNGTDFSASNAYIGDKITPTNTQGLDCSTATASGTKIMKGALSIIGNPDEVDMNMIILPGFLHSIHPFVTNAAIDMCEQRGDTFYVMDLDGLTGSIANAVANSTIVDSNYAATYYPWVKILDTAKNKPIWVPPSVVLPGVIAFNDQVAAEWYAPAGLNRGGLPNVIDVKERLKHSDRDKLYVARINPIATFPGQGATVFGQKTLQSRPSALDRINVRRLLIAVKKFIASTSRYLLFEQNNAATRNRFLSIVNPYLESIQQRNGLYAFKVVMDESNNTTDMIDRNMLKGDIFLQPAKSVEFIVLDFTVLPTGAVFPE